jgi:hypothetical protein
MAKQNETIVLNGKAVKMDGFSIDRKGTKVTISFDLKQPAGKFVSGNIKVAATDRFQNFDIDGKPFFMNLLVGQSVKKLEKAAVK